MENVEFKKEFLKEFKSTKRKFRMINIASSMLLSALLTFILYFSFYHNYTVTLHSLFGIAIPIPLNVIESFGAGVLLFTFAFELLFCKNYVLKNIPDQYHKLAERKVEDDANDLTEGDKPLMVGIVVILVAILAISYLSINCFGYNDTSIRFSDSNSMIVKTAKYEDFDLCKLKGHYDDGSVFLYGDDAYGIVSKDGKSCYDFGTVSDEFKDSLMEIYHNDYKEYETIDNALQQYRE